MLAAKRNERPDVAAHAERFPQRERRDCFERGGGIPLFVEMFGVRWRNFLIRRKSGLAVAAKLENQPFRFFWGENMA